MNPLPLNENHVSVPCRTLVLVAASVVGRLVVGRISDDERRCDCEGEYRDVARQYQAGFIG